MTVEDKLFAVQEVDPHNEGANWTLSTEPEVMGWETEGGRSGYGLSKPQAERIAARFNAHAALVQAVEKSQKALESIHELKDNEGVLIGHDFDEDLIDAAQSANAAALGLAGE